MQAKSFVDYYELFECSPNASMATIERLFRHLAKEYHPDVADRADAKKFSELVEVFRVLNDPEKRAAYDRQLKSHRETAIDKEKPESGTGNDTEERKRILGALSNRRRNNMKNPGLPQSALAELLNCDEKVIEFHLWYFMQKGWVQREESGLLSITANGIDRIDEMNITMNQKGSLKIEV
jgi:curved DNA-binding protein CbpA